MSKINTAVIFGGKSNEHDVSGVSAAHVIKSIPKDKYNVICIGITKSGNWIKYSGDIDDIPNHKWESHPDNIHCILSPDPADKGFIAIDKNGSAEKIPVDVVFPVLHGKNGEDGTIQGLFELAEIPFVGCDLISSANCMDKSLTHTVLEANGIKTAEWITMLKSDMDRLDEFAGKMEENFGYPIFVKPANCGSSVGVSKADNMAQLKEGIKLAFMHDKKLVAEKGIKGIECECAVMGNEEPFASTVGEVCSANDQLYDYDAKYNDAASETIIPARMSKENIEEIRQTAVKAYKAMGCSGLARVDFFLCECGKVILNEINTLPGHTPISMYPKLMEYEGIGFEEQEDRLIQLALKKAEADHE